MKKGQTTMAGAAGLEPSGQDLYNYLIRWYLDRSIEMPKSQKTHIYVTVEKPCMEMRSATWIRDLGRPKDNVEGAVV